VLILEPGDHLHIGKARFHAFRKMGKDTLAEEDCHSDLRKKIHSRKDMDEMKLERMINFSVAWDWSFLGWTPEGINREMTTTLERAIRNRKQKEPKQSLAIPKFSVVRSCQRALTVLTAAGHGSGVSNFGFGILTTEKKARERAMDILKGLLPCLECIVKQEHDDLANLKVAGKKAQSKPNSSAKPGGSTIDAYGNGDYICKLCFQEILNSYMHCVGCERLLAKDFNVCVSCHLENKDRQFVIMSSETPAEDSAFNHTGDFPGQSERRNCKRCKKTNIVCAVCGNGRRCCCWCHTEASVEQRMWDADTLSNLVTDTQKVVGENKLEHHNEVAPRLKNAEPLYQEDAESHYI
jgi:hypothetical protein